MAKPRNASAPLDDIVGCTITLHGLPLPPAPSPSIVWYDTDSGRPLAEQPPQRDDAARSDGRGAAPGDLAFAAPVFREDAAAFATL